jgi:hypothetical protein
LVWFGPRRNIRGYRYGLRFESFQEGDFLKLRKLLTEMGEPQSRWKELIGSSKIPFSYLVFLFYKQSSFFQVVSTICYGAFVRRGSPCIPLFIS